MSYFNNHSHSHVGSNQRLKDSINRIPESIDYCCDELNLLGIAFTDHASTSSALQACKYYFDNEEHFKSKGFKVAFGEECYLCPETVTKENVGNNHYNHFVLTALTANGHKGIREMSSRAWTQNAFMHVMMRVPLYYSDLAEILPKYKGEIIGSSACLAGAIGHRLLQYHDIEFVEPKRYKEECWDSLIGFIDTMNDLFGKGYFFLELQPSNHEEQRYVNKKIIQLSKETGTDYIWTTDAHYMKKEDHHIHSMFLASQDKSENRDEFYDSTYFMSADEIHEYGKEYLTYDEIQLGLNNTKKIYDMVTMYDLRKPLKIPYVPLDKTEPDSNLYFKYKDKMKYLSCLYESKYDSDRHLVREIINKIDERPKEFDNDLTYKAIDECLKSLIDSSEKMGVRWSAYLLSVHDIVSLLWQKSVVMPGRGSGVGFILNYILDITDINPLRETTKTYPWRFLNPERASVLDIDVDIEGSKREECLELLQSVYGEDHISKVLTYSTVKSRSAIQTAGRALGIDNDITQYIGSLIPSDRGQLRTLTQVYYGDDDYEPITEFVNEVNKYPNLLEYSLKFEMLVDGVGAHAGGIILSETPLTDSCSLQRTNSGDIITSYDLHECEDVSLIKYDNLSIEAADKIHACLDLLLENGEIEWKGSLRETFRETIGTYNLERRDPKMWEMLHRHEVYSFFQMEKQSGVAAIALSKPYSVDDLATLNSVIRLMAQEKGAESPLEKFARFKNDITEWYKEMTEYGLTEEEQDILKDILGTSYGICEAQEYLVLLTNHPKIGGFSLGWGDRLRKAVAKKKPKDFVQLEKEFFDNMKEKNLSKNLCNYVWNVLISTQRGLT